MIAMLFTPWALYSIATVFGYHVAIIVSTRSNKKVIWSNTRRFIAMMADKATIGNYSIMNNPRYTMSSQCITTMPARIYHSITKVVGRSSPQPTTICLINQFPEPLVKRYAFYCHIAIVSCITIISKGW